MKFLKCFKSNRYRPKSNVSVKRIKKSRGHRSSPSSQGSRRKRSSYIASSFNKSVCPDEFIQQPRRSYSSQELLDQFYSGSKQKRRTRSQPEMRADYYDSHQLSAATYYNNSNQRTYQTLPPNIQSHTFGPGEYNFITPVVDDSPHHTTSGIRHSISVNSANGQSTGLSVMPLQQQQQHLLYKQQSTNTPLNSNYHSNDLNNNNQYDRSNGFGVNPHVYAIENKDAASKSGYVVRNVPIIPAPHEYNANTLNLSVPPPAPMHHSTPIPPALPARTLYQQALMHPRVQQLQQQHASQYGNVQSMYSNHNGFAGSSVYGGHRAERHQRRSSGKSKVCGLSFFIVVISYFVLIVVIV